MVYKKYVYKRGRKFGPYYYESYRDGEDVRKVYIGGEKEYKEWLNKNRKGGEKVEQLVVISKKSLDIGLLLFLLSLLTLIFVIGVNVGYFFNVSPLIMTGFSVSENNSFEGGSALLYGNYEDEAIVEQFDTETIDLEIKEPQKFAGEAVSENKNKRMDFELPEGNLRLYFNLLNYSSFVGDVEDVIVQEEITKLKAEKTNAKEKPEEISEETSAGVSAGINETSEQVADNATEQITDNTYNNQNESVEQPKEQEEPQEIIESGSKSEPESGAGESGNESGITGNIIRGITGFISRIAGFSVDEQKSSISDAEKSIIAEDITINEVQERVRELTEKEIQKIEENSKIEAEDFGVEVENPSDKGYKWGYKVKLNDLNFMAKIDITSDKELSIWNENTIKIGNNLLSFADLEKAGYTIRIEKPALETEVEKEIIQEQEISEEETAEQEQIGENITETAPVNGNVSGDGKAEGEINETAEQVADNTTEQIIDITDNTNNNQNESVEQLEEQEKPVSKEAGNETSITGNIIKSIVGITGRITGRVSGEIMQDSLKTEIKDLEYKNTLSVYIERDFANTEYKVGDIINLDPTLTIIEITKAVHLDENRIFISDIYESVKNLDGNWSETINNNEYVRVKFEQNLTKERDITLYARSTNNCSINPNGSIVINGESVPCDIYEKKKRVDEIRRLLEE